MTVLVALSGGPDSTYALKKAVEAGEVVRAITFHLVSMGKGYEVKAAHKIADYFSHAILSYDTYNIETVDGINELSTTMAHEYYMLPYVANMIKKHRDIYAVSFGLCQDDYHTSPDPTRHRYFVNDEKRVDAALTALVGYPIDRFAYSMPVPTKQEIREYLGEDLWGMTYSCNFDPDPELDNMCGHCLGCYRRLKTHAPDTPTTTWWCDDCGIDALIGEPCRVCLKSCPYTGAEVDAVAQKVIAALNTKERFFG